MATYDMTSKATVGVGADSIYALPSAHQHNRMYLVEAVLDIDALVKAGYTFASGDVFNLLPVPADTLVLAAGANVTKAFDGTTPVVDIDFAGGDDIVDGGDVSSTGWLAGGTNGQGLVVGAGAANTFTQLNTSNDTIDVTLSVAGGSVTEGRLRVVAIVVDMREQAGITPAVAARNASA